MAKRPAWHPSDIRDWDEPRSPGRPNEQAPLHLAPETELLVEVGRETLSMKLRDLADLLSEAERRKLSAALAKGRTLSVPARPGRAAMTISAPAGKGAAGAEE